MTRNDERPGDWLDEVWRVKEELSAEARRMGLREYLAYAEREAERILGEKVTPASAVARDRRSDPR